MAKDNRRKILIDIGLYQYQARKWQGVMIEVFDIIDAITT